VQRTIDVRDDFIELAGKLAALNEIATRYQGLGNESLEERLGALTTCVWLDRTLDYDETDTHHHHTAPSTNSLEQLWRSDSGNRSLEPLNRWVMLQLSNSCSVACHRFLRSSRYGQVSPVEVDADQLT